jgi:hypothetical protein
MQVGQHLQPDKSRSFPDLSKESFARDLATTKISQANLQEFPIAVEPTKDAHSHFIAAG